MDLPQTLVDAEWLASHLGRPDLVVADVRWYAGGGGRAAHEAGHIPGAVFVDVDSDLAAPRRSGSGRHPLPSPEAFAGAMGALGIGDGSAVMAYDDAGGANAARLWWMLRTLGREAAVLDGGLRAWTGPLDEGPVDPEPAAFTPQPWPAESIVGTDDVDRMRDEPTAVVLDVRSAERYRGEVEPIDRVAGHIPGARSAPFTGNLDPTTGRFLSPDLIRDRYAELMAAGGYVAVHCGSGVTACHTLLALEVAGLPGARLYPGSWSEWIADPSRPIATGAAPTGGGSDPS